MLCAQAAKRLVARTAPSTRRCLATAHKFSDQLDSGPSLDDFIRGNGEAHEPVVLGNTSQYARDSSASRSIS